MEPQEKANRQSWPEITPLPEKRGLLTVDLVFNRQEFEKISHGVIPHEMEDKWFIFLEDNVLYFHRSWTGFCIYQLKFEKRTDSYAVIEALVSRDPSQYTETDDDRDRRWLSYLTNTILLGNRSSIEEMKALLKPI